MRLLMMTWEYPPNVVGGLSRHVYYLSKALARSGVEVHVLTQGQHDGASDEAGGGVNVHRASSVNICPPDFLAGVLQMNLSLLSRGYELFEETGGFDIIHAHDWLVGLPGRMLKHRFKVPLVATIHATEAGRNHGIHNELQRYISDVEWWTTYEAWRVICCSNSMKREVMSLFSLPGDKVHVVPNGVEPNEFVAAHDGVARIEYAAPDEGIIFYVGRLVQEKGVQILLSALRTLVDWGKKAKLVVAGTGPFEHQLKQIASSLGIAHHVYFTGHVPDVVRNKLYRWADVAVFPSLYEPFGIVALEAMAAGCPVVVSDAGGFPEVVTDGVNGLVAHAGDVRHLASKIAELMDNRGYAANLAKNAAQLVHTKYLWSKVAEDTLKVYSEVLDLYRQSGWGMPDVRKGGKRKDARSADGRGRGFPVEAPYLQHTQTPGSGGQPAGDGTHH
ncbi:MAG: glycosyltransferase family 4 protein [Bacillota bacterium]